MCRRQEPREGAERLLRGATAAVTEEAGQGSPTSPCLSIASCTVGRQVSSKKALSLASAQDLKLCKHSL